MADIIEMKMPSPRESITEVEVAQFLVENGEVVELDQAIAEIDSDKATLELNAEAAGKIEFLVEEGDTIEVGQVVCKIDTSVQPEEKPEEPAADDKKSEEKAPAPEEKKADADQKKPSSSADVSGAKATPVAKAMMQDGGVNPKKVQGSGEAGKILKRDVELYLAGGMDAANELAGWGGTREQRREKMSTLRRKVAERLVSV